MSSDEQTDFVALSLPGDQEAVMRPIPLSEKPAVVEERRGEIEFRAVNNDGERESAIILSGLKCIFQKQLPEMPKAYIARL
ncbi:Histone acetyltransferase GCN5, partial [Fusarium oligoseptatum]